MRYVSLTCLGLIIMTGLAWADDRPPAGAKPLSVIVYDLERTQTDLITEIDFDDGKWEIEARKGDEWVELHIDPRSGEIIRREQTSSEDDLPPAGSLPLSGILQSLERAHNAPVTDVEFDDGHWEIELHDGSREIEVKVNPRTGQARDD